MERRAFSDLVENVKATRNLLDLPRDRPPEPGTVQRIEQDLRASLPDDFVWFLAEYGGGDFGFISIYSADPTSSFYLLANQPALQREFVAVSDDGTGNLLGFTILERACVDRIDLLDHETGQIRPTEYGTFLDFVARLAFSPA